MDKDLMLTKLESLRRCIQRIDNKKPIKIEQLKEDYDLQDIISINLQRAVQISVDIATHIIADSNEKIPSTMGECFKILHKLNIINKKLASKLNSAVGFRNISVHEYQKIDWNIVYKIISKNLKNFKIFTKNIINEYNLIDE